MDGPFCPDKNNSKIIEEYGSVFAIEDNYPVTKGHLLIIPHRHTPDFFSMTSDEAKDAEHLSLVRPNPFVCLPYFPF